MAKHKVKRSLSVDQLLRKNYPVYNLSPEWQAAIGLPEKNFRMIVYGNPGQGKTTFVMKLCKELARHGKVYYNSIEQGEGRSIQQAFIQCGMENLSGHDFSLGDRDSFEDMFHKLKTARIDFCVIDSLNYMSLTVKQYQLLIEAFPRKVFIIICWGAGSKGNKPKGEQAKGIEFMVDIKTHVYQGVARSFSRFGETKPYQIFPPRSLKQTSSQAELALEKVEEETKEGEAA